MDTSPVPPMLVWAPNPLMVATFGVLACEPIKNRESLGIIRAMRVYCGTTKEPESPHKSGDIPGPGIAETGTGRSLRVQGGSSAPAAGILELSSSTPPLLCHSPVLASFVCLLHLFLLPSFVSLLQLGASASDSS